MPRDGEWDAAAVRKVQARHAPSQAALPLGQPAVRNRQCPDCGLKHTARNCPASSSELTEKQDPNGQKVPESGLQGIREAPPPVYGSCPDCVKYVARCGTCGGGVRRDSAGNPLPNVQHVTSQENVTKIQPDADGWYELVIPGEPQVWERAGVKVITPRGNMCPKCGKSDRKPIAMHYTPEETRKQEAFIAASWKAAGGPYLTGRLQAEILVFQTTFKNGNLRNGDWDNFGKLVSDALNTEAYKDDVLLRDVRVIKEVDNHNPRMVIRLRKLP